MPTLIRNPSIEPCTLPYPLMGIIAGGKSVVVDLTVAALIAACPGLDTGFRLEALPSDYAGPIDSTYEGFAGNTGGNSGGAYTVSGNLTVDADVLLIKAVNHVLKVNDSTASGSAGGHLTTHAGNATSGNANGGNYTADVGTKNGSGTNGVMDLGANASAFNFGKSGVDSASRGDLKAPGGFKTNLGGFTATLAANQSATKFLRNGMTAGAWCATHDGSVMGLAVQVSAAPTVSDVNVFVTINGTKVAAGTLVLSAGGGVRNAAAFAKDTATLTFTAGDYIGICYDSAADLGNTPTAIGDVVVEF